MPYSLGPLVRCAEQISHRPGERSWFLISPQAKKRTSHNESEDAEEWGYVEVTMRATELAETLAVAYVQGPHRWGSVRTLHGWPA